MLFHSFDIFECCQIVSGWYWCSFFFPALSLPPLFIALFRLFSSGITFCIELFYISMFHHELLRHKDVHKLTSVRDYTDCILYTQCIYIWLGAAASATVIPLKTIWTIHIYFKDRFLRMALSTGSKFHGRLYVHRPRYVLCIKCHENIFKSHRDNSLVSFCHPQTSFAYQNVAYTHWNIL